MKYFLFAIILLTIVAQTAKATDPCMQDKEKFCKDKASSDLAKCMISNRDKLSKECSAEIDKGTTMVKSKMNTLKVPGFGN